MCRDQGMEYQSIESDPIDLTRLTVAISQNLIDNDSYFPAHACCFMSVKLPAVANESARLTVGDLRL